VAILFERVAIVGVGLIGGSLALAARAAGLVGHVTGVGRGVANLATARQRGIADRTIHRVEDIGPVDLVVLATPVRTIPTVAGQLAPRLRPGTVVTDVGSVKGSIVDELEKILPAGCPFVGAHPIAGSERSGAEVAEAELFRGAPCVLTPTATTDAAAVQRIESLWQGVGARVLRMSPAEHDRALAWTSHLVHALAYCLAQAVDASGPAALSCAGPSLRETTRVAASTPGLWSDIFLANAPALVEVMETFLADLDRLKQSICSGDEEAIARLLEAGRRARERLEAQR
jgi:prephenate dehydrogenase